MKPLSYGFLALSLALLAFVIVRYAASPERVTVHIEAGPPQPQVSPAEAGIDPTAIAQAVEYAGGRHTRALLIGRGNHLVFQKYWDDSTLATPVEIPGFTPALAALAVGTAINDKLIAGVDAPAANYLPSLVPANSTVRDLLSSHTGTPEYEHDVDALARLLEKVTSQEYPALVADRLWRPLEAGEFALVRRGRNAPVRADCCMRARLGDWMRVGEALANDGVFMGNQLTPPGFVKQMLSPTHKESPVGFQTHVDGVFAAHDVARLESKGGQRLWLVPSLQLVILRFGRDPGNAGWDETMIPDTIIRGTSGWHSAAVGSEIDPNKFAPH